jgi:hypothetical protein
MKKLFVIVAAIVATLFVGLNIFWRVEIMIYENSHNHPDVEFKGIEVETIEVEEIEVETWETEDIQVWD